MTPELLEACAQRAYEIFAANTGETASWGAVKQKTAWIDAVNSHHNHPDAIRRKSDANMQERCIAQAYRELYQPAVAQPLVVPALPEEHKQKGSKTK